MTPYSRADVTSSDIGASQVPDLKGPLQSAFTWEDGSEARKRIA
jgi:hypothetical protein